MTDSLEVTMNNRCPHFIVGNIHSKMVFTVMYYYTAMEGKLQEVYKIDGEDS